MRGSVFSVFEPFLSALYLFCICVFCDERDLWPFAGRTNEIKKLSELFAVFGGRKTTANSRYFDKHFKVL